MSVRYHQGSEVRADRVRQVYVSSGSRALGPTRCNQGTHRRAPQASRSKSQPSRTQTKTKTPHYEAFCLGFGPRFRVLTLVDLRRCHLAGDFGKGQALADDLRYDGVEAVT